MRKMTRPLILAAATLALAAPAAANPGKNNGVGWGVGGVPPGHQKKMQRYEERDVRVIREYVVVRDPGLYGLPTLPADQIYVRQNDEIYRIFRDTAVVVEAIGIVSDLLN